MEKKCEVTASSLRVRSGPSLSNSQISSVKKGEQVTVYEEKAEASENITWGKISKTENKWVSMEYLKVLSSTTATDKNTTTSATDNTNNTAYDGSEIDYFTNDKATNDTIYGNSDSSYADLYRRYLRAFGCPPRFTTEVDPRYNGISGISVGRSTAETWFSNPAILSLCPGKVDYLPGFGFKNAKKNKLFLALKNATSNRGLQDKMQKDADIDMNGPLYAFNSAYTDYINVVNLLARTAANFMGIGNVKNLLPGNSIPLNRYDYGYYTSEESSGKANNIFEETKKIVDSFVYDNTYIHFFVNHSNGVTGTDSFQTRAGESWLESMLGDDNNDLSMTARNLEFLFGTKVGGNPAVDEDIKKVISEASNVNEFLGGIANISKNYLQGGRLIFPKMITGMSYEKSIRCELTFSSLYGDKRSIFKYVILPVVHLLAMATPKQVSSNMYTYPFLVRAYQRGNINADLAFIDNLELTRGGGPEGTNWTVDGLATEITASFSITPLYSNMMVTSARNPLLFFHNTALMEYLGTMCGLDLKQNNLASKIKNAKDVLSNMVFDTPTVLARGLTDSGLANGIRNFTQITNN